MDLRHTSYVGLNTAIHDMELVEVSRVLLDHGANVNEMEEDSAAPLHFSEHNGHLEIVKLLLERGADVYALNETGETPCQISMVFKFGYREIARFNSGAYRAQGKVREGFYC